MQKKKKLSIRHFCHSSQKSVQSVHFKSPFVVNPCLLKLLVDFAFREAYASVARYAVPSHRKGLEQSTFNDKVKSTSGHTDTNIYLCQICNSCFAKLLVSN